MKNLCFAFAYLDRYNSFEHRVDKFLNSYMDDMNNKAFDEQGLERQFIEMLEFVDKYFSYGFKRTQLIILFLVFALKLWRLVLR